MSDEQDVNSVVGIAKAVSRRKNGADNIVVLPYGVRAKIMPVTASLISDVTSKMKEPKPPLWHNATMDRDEPNFDHPDYIEDMREFNRKRGDATMDAMAMFGLDLVDPLPEDGTWLKKLKYLERKQQLDLSEYDLEDPFDLEFLFKRYIAVDNSMLQLISEFSGITQEEIAEAERSFQRN